MRFCVAIVVLLGISSVKFAVAAGPTTEQASTQPAARMEESFADLASGDARKREAARVELMGLKREDLPNLRDIAKAARPLAPSQAAALREIVAHVYLAGIDSDSDDTGAFLGLHDTTDSVLGLPSNLPGVVVQTRVPGYCAYRFLQEGDLIQRILEPREKDLASFADLQRVVMFMPAGDSITLQVLRQGETRHIRIPLDSRPPRLQRMQQMAFDDFLKERNDLADAYWQKEFAPLFEKTTF